MWNINISCRAPLIPRCGIFRRTLCTFHRPGEPGPMRSWQTETGMQLTALFEQRCSMVFKPYPVHGLEYIGEQRKNKEK